MARQFQGTLTALVTPFCPSSSAETVDYQALGNLLEWQIDQGVSGVVVCGTTGEAATLSNGERREILSFVVRQAAGRLQVVAGTGTNSTKQTIEFSKEAQASGADGVLLVSPYYNKPTQEGLYQHFATVAQTLGDLPVLLYNIPGRTCVNIEIPTLKRLAEIPNIVGIKEACDSVSRLMEISSFADESFSLLAGDDPTIYSVMTANGVGVISATSNVFPREVRAITDNALRCDWPAALRAQQFLLPRVRSLFSETNPGPIKMALEIMGIIPSAQMRLPLVAVSSSTKSMLENMLAERR